MKIFKKWWFWVIVAIIVLFLIQFFRMKAATKGTDVGNGMCKVLSGGYFPYGGKSVCRSDSGVLTVK